jgi:hypothetical protein
VRRVEGMHVDLTGKDKLNWFLLHAEAESGVVQGFRLQGAVLPLAPEAVCSSSVCTLIVCRSRSKPTYVSIDDVEEEELVGTYVFSFGQSVNKDNHTYLELKHFVYLVGLHVYYKVIHGPYSVKLTNICYTYQCWEQVFRSNLG